jgi:HK97 family phage major capsid protein
MNAINRTMYPAAGLALARSLRLLASAGGSLSRALEMANSYRGQSGEPTDENGVTVSELVKRALAASNFAAGGALVSEQQSSDLIDLLRNATAVRKLGALSIPMPKGNMSISRIKGSSNIGYVGENTDTSATEPSTGSIRLSAKTLLALVPISNSLLQFSDPSADQVVLGDLLRQIAVVEDMAFIRGPGTDFSPRGLRFLAETTTPSAAVSSPSLADVQQDLQQAISNLDTANVPMARPGWIINPRTKNFISSLTTTTGAYIFRDELAAGKLMGLPYVATNGVPNNLGGGGNQTEIYLADFSEAIIGDVPNVEFTVSSVAAYVDATGTLRSAFSEDVTVIKVVRQHDFALRHTESATVITGVLY